MDSRWARVARGFAAAAFATFVAAFSHVGVGGGSVSAFGLFASLVISVVVCTLLAGRTLSVWRLAASIALSQALFHWLFSGLGTPMIARHTMESMSVDAAATHLHGGATMWLAHAVAALVTVVVFRHAESAFWSVATTARLLLTRLLLNAIPLLVGPARTTVVMSHRFAPRDLTLLLSSMRHRGPPPECA